jgi:hypothetical protein
VQRILPRESGKPDPTSDTVHWKRVPPKLKPSPNTCITLSIDNSVLPAIHIPHPELRDARFEQRGAIVKASGINVKWLRSGMMNHLVGDSHVKPVTLDHAAGLLTSTLFTSKIARGASQEYAAMLGDIPGEKSARRRLRVT